MNTDIELTEEQFAAFVERLEQPAQINPALQKLLQTKSPWEQE